MYRDGPDKTELVCPRCKKQPLPPLDVATCVCGTWVTAFAAPEVFSNLDLRPDPVTRWWRVREPCPVCGEKMKLHGIDPHLFQGCPPHGYFVDADIVPNTSLAHADLAAVERLRGDDTRAEAVRAKLDALELAAAAERERRAGGAEAARQRLIAAAQVRAVQDRATRLRDALARVLGPDEADELLGRIAQLERENAQLRVRLMKLGG